MMKRIVPLLLLLCTAVLAFNPPTGKKDGITAEIVGVEEKYELGKPVPFQLKLSNASGGPVQAEFRIWLNDDWQLEGQSEQKGRMDVADGAQAERSFTAQPLARCLAAFYPVHAVVTVTAAGKAPFELHPIAVFEVIRNPQNVQQEPLKVIELTEGQYELNTLKSWRKSVTLFPAMKTIEFSGNNEPQSRAAFGHESGGFRYHPPWNKVVEAGTGDGAGTGTVQIEFLLKLPAGKNIRFLSDVSLRQHNANEPPSDGVEFFVKVTENGRAAKTVASRFTDTKAAQPFAADLSPYAGKEILLTIGVGPGPKFNTCCDNGVWKMPRVVVGEAPQTITAAQWHTMEEMAKDALKVTIPKGKTAFGRRQTSAGEGAIGVAIYDLDDCRVAVVLGEEGLLDAVIAISDGTSVVCYHGFDMFIDGTPIGRQATGRLVKSQATEHDGVLTVRHEVSRLGGAVPFEVAIRPAGGTLTFQFGMPGVTRNLRGEPRFTKLSLGASDQKPWRMYAGFGNVIEEPANAWRLTKGGFSLSTRHIGVDYRNGLSAVLASDFFPDAAVCDPKTNLFTLEFHNDALFYLAPAKGGAFAAAKKYAAVNGFKASPGLPMILGRQCLDQWGGDYLDAADDIRLAGLYGLNHSVFVKHVWQRWGYDYRLPEIYPPADGLEPFRALSDACRRNGILFAPHDNYIDFYPDAKGYSYDHIIFNEDGTPQRAWFNKGRKAQSYRWLPHAFRPWLVENMQLIRDGIAPQGLFIDVFTAIAPRDYYDREGRFYTAKRMAAEWSAAFDTCREILQPGCPMISECGHDGLVGSLDAGQSDHYPASAWGVKASAMDRTPWHDIVSHGKMVLLAGGLGSRYAKSNIDEKRSYGSDDYLSNTVLGGRNPMSGGPFSRTAVMTYWLLHDVCDWLAHASFDSHSFSDTVCQQQTTFGGGKGRVWANRGETEWRPRSGLTLPTYGFWVETPVGEAGVYQQDGRTVGYANTLVGQERRIFADARPAKYESRPLIGREMRVAATAGPLRLIDGNTIEFDVDWDVRVPYDDLQWAVFLHVCHPQASQGENISFQGGVARGRLDLTQAGRQRTTLRATLPQNPLEGTFKVCYGVYSRQQGTRIPFSGLDVRSNRALAGEFSVKKAGDKYELTLLPSAANEAGTVEAETMPLVAFKELETNGALRVICHQDGSISLIPLPGSHPFRTVLKLGALRKSGKTFTKAECLEKWDEKAAVPEVKQEGNRVSLTLDGKSLGCRLYFE